MLSAKCSLRIAVLIGLLTLPAFAREWRITNFSSSMEVAPDGTMTVRENLAVSFEGEFHGIYRDIPIQYPGPHGSNYSLFLTVTGVTDGQGRKLKYESSVQGDFRHLKIYVPNAVNTTKVVAISYTVKNAVRWFDDHDELYFNVTGNDWPVPIDSAMAIILFPPNAANNLRGQAFTGVYGSEGRDATVTINGNVVKVSTNNTLDMREGLTADVYITKGILTEPSQLTFALWFIRSNVIVLLPLWAFVVMFFFWWTKGRDPKADISVAPMYDPPKDMTPAEVGALTNDAVHPRDITSTLVDLAVKGYLKIEEVESKMLLFSHRDYIFHSLKPQGSWSSLEAHERVMLKHMFPADATQIRMSELRNQFYVAIPTIKEDILAELRAKGMYSVDPDSAHAYVFIGVLLTALPFVLLQVFKIADVLASVGMVILAGIISLLIVFLFARIMPAKSLKGVRTKIEILGLQEFINRVDADRLKRMPPDTFEKILPYAMVLGIENRWAKSFEGIVQNPPTWYVGPTPCWLQSHLLCRLHACHGDGCAPGVRCSSASQQHGIGLGRRGIQRRGIQRRRLRRRWRRRVLKAVVSCQHWCHYRVLSARWR